MSTALLTIFLLALMAPTLYRVLRCATGWALAVPVAGITGWFATLLPGIAGGGVFQESRAWVPALGIDLAFRVDGWGLVFLLLIGGTGCFRGDRRTIEEVASPHGFGKRTPGPKAIREALGEILRPRAAEKIFVDDGDFDCRRIGEQKALGGIDDGIHASKMVALCGSADIGRVPH